MVMLPERGGALEFMKHKTLAVVEADAEVPLLPVDVVAVDREARALGLHHV